MGDGSAFKRVFKKAGQQLTRTLGLKKPQRTGLLSESQEQHIPVSEKPAAGQTSDRSGSTSTYLNKAIKEFGAKGSLDATPRWKAAGTIARMRDHLQPQQQSKLSKIVRRRPELNQLINDEISRMETIKESLKLKEEAVRENEPNKARERGPRGVGMNHGR